MERLNQMLASKVTITPETRAKLDAPALSPSKWRQLREELIKDCIRNRSGGAATKQELVAAAGLNPEATSTEYAKGIHLLKRMVERGIISHNNTNQYRKSWTVIEDVKVKPSPKQVASEVVIPEEVTVELKEYNHLTSMKLVEMAKEFAWRTNSDSLREFIAYTENAIK
jgi:hypothetical protein